MVIRIFEPSCYFYERIENLLNTIHNYTLKVNFDFCELQSGCTHSCQRVLVEVAKVSL